MFVYIYTCLHPLCTKEWKEYVYIDMYRNIWKNQCPKVYLDLPMPQGGGTGAWADPTKATATPRHGGDAPVTPPAAHGTGRHPTRATVR